MTSNRFALDQDQHLSSVLRLEQVSLKATVGAALLLQNISFAVQPGEIIAIVGASGAGKTSLLRLLNGLVSPNHGEIYLNDQAIAQYTAIELRRRLVLVLQEPKLLGMRVIDALTYPLKLQQMSDADIKPQVERIVSLLRIPAEWLSKTELQLSLGQRQLVAIARALIMQPQVILLDEPTSALDLGMANYLLEVLKQLNREENLTIMMANHQLEIIQSFCERLFLLDQGNLIEDMVATSANWQKVRTKILQLEQRQTQEWLE
ncbi:MAG: ATP-binding cassette domain-containing protein [Cyanobacteria bacterium P01_C01_bin.72]